MNRELNERVLACVQASGTGDGDQRSALGMARTWVEKRKPIVRQNYLQGQFRLRDDLAEALVKIIEDSDREDCVIALRAAREWINAPFVDSTMNGRISGKAAILKPGGARNDETGASA